MSPLIFSFSGCTASSAAAVVGLACAIEKMAASDRIQARGRSRSRAAFSRHTAMALGAGARLRRQLPDAAQPSQACAGSGSYSSASASPKQSSRTQCSRPECAQALGQLDRNRVQIQNIVRGVFQLRAGQRPLRPIGARLALGYASPRAMFLPVPRSRPGASCRCRRLRFACRIPATPPAWLVR